MKTSLQERTKLRNFNDYFINIPERNMLANQENEFLDSSKKIFF